MGKKINVNQCGQSALFDALIYLIVMIVASGLIAVYAGQHVRDAELSENHDMMEYCRDTSEVILGATLNFTWYEDINGIIIRKPPGDTTVLNLLMEELYLRDDGVPEENFILGYEKDIQVLARNLVLPSYHFALSAAYENPDTDGSSRVFISDIEPQFETKEGAKEDGTDYSQSIPKNNLTSVQMTFPMVKKPGNVTITFSIWL